MLVLTDQPQKMEPFLSGESWVRLADHPLTDADLRLWRCLSPDREPWIGETHMGRNRFWSHLILKSEAPSSQFDALCGILREGWSPPGPVAALALTGHGFHGQHGRSWAVASGNLHLSVALSPGLAAATAGPALNMLPVVATAEAVREVTGGLVVPGIKWVNDLLISGRKVGGVLAATQIKGDRVESAVLGVGLNVASAPRVEANPFVPATCCLRDCSGEDRALDLPIVLTAVLKAISTRFQELLERGPGSLLAEYLRLSLVLGRHVRIWEESVTVTRGTSLPPPSAVGVVREILPDLSLMLEGRKEPVVRGRLALD